MRLAVKDDDIVCVTVGLTVPLRVFVGEPLVDGVLDREPLLDGVLDRVPVDVGDGVTAPVGVPDGNAPVDGVGVWLGV